MGFVDAEVALPNLTHIRYSGDGPDYSFIRQLIEKGTQSSLTRVSILRRGTQQETEGKHSQFEHNLHGLVERVEVYDDNDDFTTESN